MLLSTVASQCVDSLGEPAAKWQVMLTQGYFDDSGKESAKDAPYVCLAGYLSHQTALSHFCEEWQQLLMFHKMNAFHMKEIMSPVYCKKMGWGEADRNKVLMEFVALIPKYKLVGIGIGIDARFWKTLSPQRRKAFGSAQEFAFQRAVWQVNARLAGVRSNDYVSLLFDQDYEFSGSRLNLFYHAKRRFEWAHRFVDISFGDSRYILPLQAADLLAWESRKELLRRADGKPSTDRMIALLGLELGDQMRTKGEFWDAKTAEDKLAKAEADFASQRRSQ